MGIIGGADGPTVIFIQATNSLFSLSGLIFVILILLPNILYAICRPNEGISSTRRLLNLLEQLGRYGCMALMVSGFGLFQYKAFSLGSLMLYLIGCTVLILAYWVCWFFWFRRKTKGNAFALALLPALVFLLTGLLRGPWLLNGLAVLFGICHISITMQAFPGESCRNEVR